MQRGAADRVRGLILVSTPGPHWRMNPHPGTICKVADSREPAVRDRRRSPRLARDVRAASASAFEAVGLREHRVARRSGAGSAAPHEPPRTSCRVPGLRGRLHVRHGAHAVVTGERELDQVVPMRRDHALPASDTRLALPAFRTDRPSRDRAGARSICRHRLAILPNAMTDDIRAINVDIPGPAGLLEGLINAKTGTEPSGYRCARPSASHGRRNHAYQSRVPRG